MKKLFALALAAAMSLSQTAFADTDFDSWLGETVIAANAATGSVAVDDEMVEGCTLYVSPNGTTMIAMQPVCDAVGAEFSGDGDTAAVDYAGVHFEYTAASADMTLDGRTITMPEAAALDEGGNFVVPLRFFAESLGADVTYDAETGDIRMLFSEFPDDDVNFKMLLKYSDVTRIGNSKQKWSFDIPDEFNMNYYYGDYEFYIGDIAISFSAMKNTKKMNIDQAYIITQEQSGYVYFSDGTIFEKKKDTRAGLAHAVCKRRYTSSIGERHIFLTDEYIYMLEVRRPFENFAQEKDSSAADAFIDSLRSDYTGADDGKTLDLAKETVSESKTEYTDGNLNWSVKLSDGWSAEVYYGFYNTVYITKPTALNDDIDADNIFSLIMDGGYVEDPEIRVSVYSADGGSNAKAAHERQLLSAQYSGEYLTMSQIGETKIGDKDARTFTAEIRLSEEQTEKQQYYYLDANGYCYEIVLSYDAREEADGRFLAGAESIINSFDPGEVDSEQIGTLLEADDMLAADNVTGQIETDYMTAEYPYAWRMLESDGSVAIAAAGEDIFADTPVTLMIEKENLSVYEKDLTKKTYTMDEKLRMDLAQMLNLAPDAHGEPVIENTVFQGKDARKVTIDSPQSGVKEEYMFVQLDSTNMLIIAKLCDKSAENTHYTQMCDKIINSIKLK